jgi:hypothetical protein
VLDLPKSDALHTRIAAPLSANTIGETEKFLKQKLKKFGFLFVPKVDIQLDRA